MAFSINNRIGVDVTNTFPATIYGTTVALQKAPHQLGEQVWSNTGLLYVFGQASASIPALTAVCTLSPTTFLATASGGAYTSPATAMVTGDYGYFSKASV